ncbi:PREDICTED: syntaxin-22-like [Lupinus angustifolius]|uniref:syntaxin-22-like n=1 Tax=Lupinus angustifolius TaxID=3871 RepID=UPI00092F896A|nr:PREDICTED: syntaxin-22-like [Lupinus angustifolius]
MSFQDFQSGSNPSPRRKQSPSQAIASGIFQTNTAVATFRRLVDSVGTVKDTTEHRQKLHNTRLRILQLVKDTSASLKSFTESDRYAHANANQKIEDAKLARDFQTTLQEFQKVQQLASERESTYTPAAPPLPSSSGAGEESVEVDQESQPFITEQKRQEIVLLDNEVSFNEAVIDEREEGIREIEEQIGQANEIFRDLAVLVHEQGVVTDGFQSNIDASAGATTQARVQLSKASKSVKSRTSWCWWVLLIFLVVLVILLLVLLI